MNRRSILTKTGKGLMEATGKTSNLSRDLRNILKEIDGKVSVSELLDKFEKMTEPKLLEALSGMEREGYVREFIGKADAGPQAPAPGSSSRGPGTDASDLDFTAFTPKPSARAAEDARLQAQAHEIARQAQATRAREEAAAKARTELAATRARAEAELKAKRAAAPAADAPAPYAGILGAGADAQARAQQDALDRARREAERKESEERSKREAEARAKAEIEAAIKRESEERAKREMQERIRREDEERARREAEARAKAEAEARAKREAEERLRRELEERAKREIEERLRREEAERRLREEAERKQRVEAEARARVEAELRAKREAEERARRAEDERRRAEEEHRQAKIREAEQAEALERALREEQEKAQREEQELAQREEQEPAPHEEQEQSEREEPIFEEEAEEQRREEEERLAGEEEKRARREEKAAARAAAKARKAERARERAGEEAWRGDEDALRDTGDRRSAREIWESRKPASFAKTLGLLLVGLVIVGLAVLPFVPLETAGYEKAAQAWLGQPVKIGSVTLTYLPLPRLKFERVVIGRDPQAKAAVIRATPEFASILDERPKLRSLELENAVVPKEFLAVLLQDKSGRRGLGVERVSAKGLKIDAQELGFLPLDVEAIFSPDGALSSVSVSSTENALSVKLEPHGGRAAVEISANALPLPIGVEFGLSDFQAKGIAYPSELVMSSVEGRAFGGRVFGKARLRWSGPWSLDGEISARQMDAAKVASPLIGSGTLQGKGVFSMRGLLPERMVLNSQFDGTFTVQKGVINNVDMTRVLQGSGSGGGTTNFQEVSGTFSADPNRLQVRQIRLAAGLLSGGGQLDMDSQKGLSGRMQIELRAQSVQARATLGVSGTLTNPQFRRTN
jgi:hypothetical protein